jgi:hypothetical protein
MSGLALGLVCALLGPPKLPPIGGRSVPPPEVPATPREPEVAPPGTTDPPGAVPPPASAPGTAPPPPASAPGTVPPPPSGPPATAQPVAPPGPEVLADGPRGAAIATPRLPAGPATPLRPGLGAPPRGPSARGSGPSAAPLRLVSSDELSRWDREDASAKLTTAPATPRATTANDTTLVRTAAPEAADPRPRFRRPPHPPDRSAAFVLGYRYFRIQDALGRAQDWHLASIEVTPMRRYVRLNLITEFGVEGGEAAAKGDRADLLLMERLGLGMQYPHVVTPFLEFQGGAGGARVELFGRNDVALLYTLGLDVGAQWAVGRWLFLHAAVGWIRPTFVWPQRTLSYDRVAFKLGVGF